MLWVTGQHDIWLISRPKTLLTHIRDCVNYPQRAFDALARIRPFGEIAMPRTSLVRPIKTADSSVYFIYHDMYK
jgi:hypothetical protein